MKMKTYQADSMQEAMAKIREDLGSEAVIVKTRQIAGPGGRRRFEITASGGGAAAAAQTAPGSAPSPASIRKGRAPAGNYDWTGRLPRVTTAAGAASPAAAATPAPGSAPARPAPPPSVPAPGAQAPVDEASLRRLREEIRSLIASAIPGAENPWTAADLPPALAELLARRAHDAGDLVPRPQTLARLMAEDMRWAGGIRLQPGRQCRVLFTGPAGAGKTSLIRKLALQGRLKGGPVGLIAADRTRLGAHGELALFARTAGLPWAGIYDAREMPAALNALRSCRLLLVDSPSSPSGEEGWRQLETLRKALAPDEVHLVLNACNRERELRRAIHAFARLKPDRLAFTRLEECLGVGGLYAAAMAFPGHLSYLSYGPGSTGSVQPADGEGLRRWFAAGLSALAPAPAAAGAMG